MPSNIIQAIVDANSTRKDFIANVVLSRDTEVVSSYRLMMKEGSDNICASAMSGVMKRLNAKSATVCLLPGVTERPLS